MSEKTFKIVDNDLSDGYHTFDELYDHRSLLFLAWMESDGCPGQLYFIEEHFPGWHLVACSLPNGEQISYHIPVCYGDIIRELPGIKYGDNYVYDGYTSEDVADRIRDRLRSK